VDGQKGLYGINNAEFGLADWLLFRVKWPAGSTSRG